MINQGIENIKDTWGHPIVLPEMPPTIEILGSDGYETYVKDGKIFVRPKWISVKDQEPRKDIPILIINKYRDFPTSVRWVENGTYGEPSFFESNDEYCISIDHILFWMPLPEPPEVK